MGTTAEKLTYLGVTKEKIRDSINLTGANIGTSDTFRSYATKLNKGYIDIINNGIDTLYNNFPKVSGIGSNLSLTPTYEAPMKLNEIQGDTLQDGTPTPDTPVEIQSVTGNQEIKVTGKNLLPNIATTTTKNGITFTKNSDGTYTVSGTATANAVFSILTEGNLTNPTLQTGTYTLSGCPSGGSGNTYKLDISVGSYNQDTGSGVTFTLSEATQINYVRILVYSGQTINAVFKPMIESGNTKTSFEPYKGNTYEVNLGKNLLLFPYTENSLTRDGITYTINNDGSISISGTSTAQTFLDLYRNSTTNFLNINETYTYSISPTNSNMRLSYLEYYNNVWNDNGYGTNKITFTVSENSEGQMIRLIINNGSTINTTIYPQVETGSTATSYSPYFTPIELNKIGDYQDRIKKSTGKNIITTYNYASSGYINYNYDNSKIGKTMTYSFIPNFSTTNATLYIRANTSISAYNVGTISTITSGTKVSVTFTLTDEQYDTIKNTNGGYIQVYKSGVSMDENSISNPMLEINSQSTSYEPYGKVWYVEKNIGKVVLDGSETWNLTATYTNNVRFNSTIFLGTTTPLISNYFLEGKGGTDTTNIDTNGNSGVLMITIPKSIASTISEFTTWLSTHNTEVLYVLNTPTYTEITNTELIEDLETLYTAKSQEGTTNISITSEDLEMILNVSALKGEV